jgi:hypothetical protein
MSNHLIIKSIVKNQPPLVLEFNTLHLDSLSVSSLKQLIERESPSNFSISSQRLMFQGQILKDGKLVKEYGVVNHDIVLLVRSVPISPVADNSAPTASSLPAANPFAQFQQSGAMGTNNPFAGNPQAVQAAQMLAAMAQMNAARANAGGNPTGVPNPPQPSPAPQLQAPVLPPNPIMSGGMGMGGDPQLSQVAGMLQNPMMRNMLQQAMNNPNMIQQVTQ